MNVVDIPFNRFLGLQLNGSVLTLPADPKYQNPRSPLYRTLILGESTYEDPPEDDPQWINRWIRKEQDPEPYLDKKTGKLKKEQPDKTFSRLLWVTRGERRETCFDTYRRTSTAELKAWFNL
jgi:hypothetical protein